MCNKNVKIIILLLISFILLCLSNKSIAKDDLFSNYPLLMGSESEINSFDKARELYKNNDIESALKKLEKINEQTVYDKHLHFILASLYVELMNYERAIEEYNKVITLDSNFSKAYLNLAKAYVAEKKVMSAVRILKKLHRKEKQNLEILYKIGNLYGLNEDYDKAIDIFQEILNTDHENLKTLKSLALAYKKKGDLNNALLNYKKALAILQNADNYNNVGLCHVDKKEFREAITNFQYAVRLDPEKTDYLYNLALAYLENKQFDKSLDTISNLLVIDKNNLKALTLKEHIATVMSEAGDRDDILTRVKSEIVFDDTYINLDNNVLDLNRIFYPTKKLNQEDFSLCDLPFETYEDNKKTKISAPEKKNERLAHSKSKDELKKKRPAQIKESRKIAKKPKKQTKKDKSKENYDPLATQNVVTNTLMDNSVSKGYVQVDITDKVSLDSVLMTDKNDKPEEQAHHKKTNIKDSNSSNEGTDKKLASIETSKTGESDIKSPFSLIQPKGKANSIGDMRERIMLLEKLLILKPGNNKVRFNLALNYYKLGDMKRAEEELQKVISIDKENKDALLLLGVVYSKLNKFDKAKAIYNKLIEGENADADVYRQMGYIHYTMEEYDDAVNYYLKALETSPDDTMTRLLLALSYDKTGEFQDEIDQFNLVIAAEPDNINALRGLAFAYYSLKRMNEAVETFEKIIDVEPDEREIYFYLENLYIKQNKPEQALNILTKYVNRYPEDPEVYYSLGNIYARAGNIDTAIEKYIKAVELYPENPIYHYALGVSYIEKGIPKLVKEEINILENLKSPLSVELSKLQE